jgi:hypothetical protein
MGGSRDPYADDTAGHPLGQPGCLQMSRKLAPLPLLNIMYTHCLVTSLS